MSTQADIIKPSQGVRAVLQEVRFVRPQFVMSAGPSGLCVVVAAQRKLAS